MKFSEFGLSEGLLEGLYHMNFEEATPIQEEAIPIILEGRDLIACAQTGTGKTAAYILPTLELLHREGGSGTRVLIICPTRELAIQIDNQLTGFGYFTGMHSIPIYGGGDGADWDQQKKALSQGADIIVATPGKLISHIQQGYVNFSKISHLILDEADRMMDMGFRDDIKLIASHLPKKRQSLMFSATMAPKIRDLIKELLHNPAEINLALAKPAKGVLQVAYLCNDSDKNQLLVSLIKGKAYLKKIIVFSSTKKKVSTIVSALTQAGFATGGISSDFEQEEREEMLKDFRSGKIQILVGTDVISRGIDIKDINLVVNYDVPPNAEDYVHRVGRTARAETTGVAITFVNEKDMYAFKEIEDLIESSIQKLNISSDIGQSPNWNPTKKKNPKPKKSSFGNRRRKPKAR
ncbi:MAG TPA: DEAD/DEAH box helicase [Saprospiraceae bacterium]|nr:DEAD/DEAH box helicase [Saprospiraceae bacterium]MCB9327072.1 DEAD/DEAH box helicase [Lewinellaceae bacterium]HPK09154.1 DEAD/DEAH box helicase [Saprospiraceae bacterium]HPQ21015.1 DEAD/DEAH box helicase [Saprospiraceae bacterium]HRX28070.1 DEAD/DEAH box helicase [Saprospiraceae bacterium]